MDSSPLRPRATALVENAPLLTLETGEYQSSPSSNRSTPPRLTALPVLPFKPIPRTLTRKRFSFRRLFLLGVVLILIGEVISRQRHALLRVVRPEGLDGPSLTTPLDPVEAGVASAAGQPTGAIASVKKEYLTTRPRDDWRGVVEYFMRDIPVDSFRAELLESHYAENVNNAQGTCLLARIVDGDVQFVERYGKAHGRSASVKYMLRRIAKRKRHVLRNVTVLVMLSDGHRPRVPTLGSARHWTNWNFMIPAPLGNFRGHFQGWGSPLEKWDEYVKAHVIDTHKDYPWRSKIAKAVFRGALAMQTYKLGSCNEVNGRECDRANRWDQVNRGAMYRISRQRRDLFDVGFSQLKPKLAMGPSQFDGAPKKAPSLDFRDFQKYKYVLNVGSNQGTSAVLDCKCIHTIPASNFVVF